MSDSAKKVYVVIESGKGAPNIRGCDFYVTPWQSLFGILETALEGVDFGEPATLTFTVHEWTEEEYQAYCVKNDIEGDA